jgi:hypothetical protein
VRMSFVVYRQKYSPVFLKNLIEYSPFSKVNVLMLVSELTAFHADRTQPLVPIVRQINPSHADKPLFLTGLLQYYLLLASGSPERFPH